LAHVSELAHLSVRTSVSRIRRASLTHGRKLRKTQAGCSGHYYCKSYRPKPHTTYLLTLRMRKRTAVGQRPRPS